MSLSKAKTLGHTEITTNLHLHCQCGSEVPAKKSLVIQSQKKRRRNSLKRSQCTLVYNER